LVRCGVEAIGHGGTLLPKGGTAGATGSAGCQPTWEGTRWAGGVAFDIIFAEPDRTSPSRYIDQLDLDDAGMGQQAYTQLRRLPDHDQVLAEAMTAVPVVVGFATTERPNDRRPMRKAGFAFAGTVPTAILPPFQGSVTSLPLFEEAARGAASLSLGQDSSSGIVRQIPLLLSDGRQIYPGLALEALRVAQGATSITVRSTGASGEQTSRPPALVELRVGQFTVPMTAEGELFLRFGRNRPERLVSARDVLDPDKDLSIRPRIEGHIVFIGTSAAGLHDRRVTPLAESVAGVTIHAQAVEQIIAQDFLRRPDWAKGLEILLTIDAGGFVALLLGRLSARYAAVVMIGAIAALFGGAWLTFSRLSLLVDPLYPSLGAVAVYLAVTSLLYLTTDREKRFVRQAFSRYLAPELLQKLEAAPDQLRLGGEIRPMTILFMDVRDFTPISERLSPEALIRFLNTLFSPLTEAIQECHGVKGRGTMAAGCRRRKSIAANKTLRWVRKKALRHGSESACRDDAGVLLRRAVASRRGTSHDVVLIGQGGSERLLECRLPSDLAFCWRL
jgi:adenylate cyclase